MSRPPPDPRLRLCPPLDERWRALLDELAQSRGLARSTEVPRLGAELARLSAAYNGLPGGARPADSSLLGARLGFSFARDVPKGSAAVAELLLRGLLDLPEGRPLSVLDVGAGLGATTWGVVRAIASMGKQGTVEARLIDSDPRALELGGQIAKRARGEGGVELAASFETRSLSQASHGPERHDLVLLGQVLSEADAELSPDERAERHASLLGSLLAHKVKPEGSLIVIEPALRERSRHLHAVRARLVAKGARVFAPCLHQADCPMLAREQDWCHEDLPIDLPPWLWPVARAAGLRWQGLTFSYLVLRPDGASLGSGRPLLRVAGVPRRTKGKRELDLCGPPAEGAQALRSLTLLDRDETAENEAFCQAGRGELLSIEPAPEGERARLGRATRVARVEP